MPRFDFVWVLVAINSLISFYFIQLGHLICYILLKTLTNSFKRDSLKNRVKKSFYNDLFCLCLRNATRLEIEQWFLLQLTNCRSVRATDIICEDLKARDGICARAIAQDQISVGLIPISFLRSGRHVDHALPDRAAPAFQRALEQQVTGRILGKMILLCVMIQMLIAICEIKTGHASLRAFTRKVQF